MRALEMQRVRKLAVLAGLAAVLAIGPIPFPRDGQAQESTAAAVNHSDDELTHAVIRSKRRDIVANELKLTEREAGRFWPLYDEMQVELDEIDARLASLVTEYSNLYPNASGEEAREMLDESLAIRTAELELKKKYVPRFREVLPQIKVTRYYMIERKLDAAQQLELARSIPLIW